MKLMKILNCLVFCLMLLSCPGDSASGSEKDSKTVFPKVILSKGFSGPLPRSSIPKTIKDFYAHNIVNQNQMSTDSIFAQGEEEWEHGCRVDTNTPTNYLVFFVTSGRVHLFYYKNSRLSYIVDVFQLSTDNTIDKAWRIQPNMGLTKFSELKNIDWPRIRTFEQLKDALTANELPCVYLVNTRHCQDSSDHSL